MDSAIKLIVSTDNGTSVQTARTFTHALDFVNHAINEITPGRIVIIIDSPLLKATPVREGR